MRNIAKKFKMTMSLIDIETIKPRYKCFFGEDVELCIKVVDEDTRPVDLTDVNAKVYYTCDKFEPLRQDNDITINEPAVDGTINILVNKKYLRLGVNTIRVALFDSDQEVLLQPCQVNCIETGIGDEHGDVIVNDDINVKDEFIKTNNKVNGIDGRLKVVEGDIPEIESRLTNVSEQLDTKASKIEVDVERKRIDSFTSLSQGSTTGDAELIDARIGADGIIYSNLGTSIRTQIKNINNNFEIKTNLFDKAKVSLGYLNKGEVVLDDNFFASDFIEVNKGDMIKFSKNTNVDLFNSGKIYQVTNSTITSLTIPETTKYIRCSVYNQSAIDTYMVCKNSLPSSYLSYGDILFYVKGNQIAKYNDLEKNNNGSNVLSNVKMTSFGDSITYMNRWQPTVATITGMISTVCGVGGTRVAKRSDVDETNNNNSMCTDNRVNTIPTDTEILIFMGGMNDWAQSVPLGAIDRFNVDEYTYCGALVSMWKKIFTRCPNLKACYCLGVSTGYQPSTFVDSYGWKNNQGLYTWDYGNASMKVAQFFGVRTIDITGVGINSVTIGTKTDDGIHPTIATGVEMGELVGNRIYNDFNK